MILDADADSRILSVCDYEIKVTLFEKLSRHYVFEDFTIWVIALSSTDIKKRRYESDLSSKDEELCRGCFIACLANLEVICDASDQLNTILFELK